MQKIMPRIPAQKTLVLAVITAVILLILFRVLHFDIAQITQVDHSYLLIAMLLSIPFPLLSALRWWYVLKGMHLHTSLRNALELTIGSWPLAIFPGRIGDFARVMGLPDELPIGLSLSSVLFEKCIDIGVLILFSVTGLFWIGQATLALLCLGALVLGLFFLFFLPHYLTTHVPPNISEKVGRVIAAFALLRREKYMVIMAVLMSALNWLLSIIQVHVLFLATGASVPLVYILTWLPLAIFVGLLPITLEGMGTRDFALIVFLGAFTSAGTILTVGLWYSILGYWLLALVGLPWLPHVFKKFRH